MTQTQNLDNSWSKDDIENLGKALTFTYKMQNTYKEPLDLKDRVMGWKFVLQESYTVNEVLNALRQFVKQSPNMPVPYDILEIAKKSKKATYKMQEIGYDDGNPMTMVVDGKYYRKVKAEPVNIIDSIKRMN